MSPLLSSQSFLCLRRSCSAPALPLLCPCPRTRCPLQPGGGSFLEPRLEPWGQRTFPHVPREAAVSVLRTSDPTVHHDKHEPTEDMLSSLCGLCGSGNGASVFTRFLRQQEARKFICY